MQEKNLKNIVVLKDLQSNLIEEAIIILKDNKKTSASKIEKEKNISLNGKSFVLEQAQMVIDNYESNNILEEPINNQKHLRKIQNKKIKHTSKFKPNTNILVFIVVIQTILLLLK